MKLFLFVENWERLRELGTIAGTIAKRETYFLLLFFVAVL